MTTTTNDLSHATSSEAIAILKAERAARLCDHCGLRLNADDGPTCDGCRKANERDVANAEYWREEIGLRVVRDQQIEIVKMIDRRAS